MQTISRGQWLATVGGLTILFGGVDRLTPAAEPAKPAEAQQPATAELIDAALRAKVSLNFEETPLKEVVARLGKDKPFSIVLSRDLQNSGIEETTPVTFKINNVSLKVALRAMLSPLDLTTIIADDTLSVVTTEQGAIGIEVKTYPIGRWKWTKNAFGENVENSDPIIELILRNVASTTWDEVGGPGSICGLHDTLAVGQTQDVHEQVADLLGLLDAASAAKDFEPLRSNDEDDRPIRKALLKRVSLNFKGAPLSEVAAKLEKEHGIPVLLHRNSLEDSNTPTDTPIDFEIKNVSLQSALRILLRQYDLNYVVRGGILWIMTNETACQDLITVVYPVADLVGDGAEELVSADDEYRRVCATIVATVAPTTWDEVGGPGGLRSFPPARCLVISQTRDVHEVIEDLLTLLRKTRKTQPAIAKGEPRLHTKVYQLWGNLAVADAMPTKAVGVGSTGIALNQAKPGSASAKPSEPKPANDVPRQLDIKELIMFLQLTASPDAWKGDEAWIRPVADKLVIRQTAAVHRQVNQLLESLKLLPPQGMCLAPPDFSGHANDQQDATNPSR